MARSVPHEDASLRSFGAAQAEAFLPGQNYGALSWNIFKSKKLHWQRDFDRLHSAYDLLLLQEAKLNFEREASEQPYDPQHYSWSFGESFMLNRCGSSCGVLTGSRVLPTRAFNRHAPVPEPFLKTPKSTAFVHYPIQGQEQDLLVVNAHFINFRQTAAFRQQLQQVIAEIAQHAGPVLFAGDFNTWNKTRRTMLFRELAALGLEEVVLRNERRNFLVLDYFFVRGLDVLDAHLIHGIKSSDHLPLSLWFRIPL